MSEPRPEGVGEDAAWVGVTTDLSPAQVSALLDDPERLLRVNSQWIFETWERSADNRFRLHIRNQSNGRPWQTDGALTCLHDGLRLDYADGIKASTRFIVEPAAGGTRLWIVEDYGRLPEEERRARTDEVDRSLPRWGQDLYRYLQCWARWGRFPAWRWYMERIWRPMKPLGRRVVRLLLWVTAAELVLFLGLVVAWRVSLTLHDTCVAPKHESTGVMKGSPHPGSPP
jgi:hypothetical protein